MEDDGILFRGHPLTTVDWAAPGGDRGFGHPHHDRPRALLLKNIAKEQGVYGDRCLQLESIEVELEAAVGRPIAFNVDDVLAALISDLGLDPSLVRSILMNPRRLSLAEHFIECGSSITSGATFPANRSNTPVLRHK